MRLPEDTTGKRLALLAFALALAGLCLGCWHWRHRLWYSTRLFSGDGEISDLGFWSYPRYRIAMPSVRLGGVASHRFTLRGLPPKSLCFGLVLDDTSTGDLLESLKGAVNVSLKVQDEHGKLLCRVEAPLGKWVRMWSQTEIMYWHEQSRDLATDPRSTYTIDLLVDGKAPPGSVISMTPTLQGGGIDLP